MPSKFFRRNYKELKHHTCSLLPEVEAIIRVSEKHFVEHITNITGEEANFSVSTNLIVLARMCSAVSKYRHNQPFDPEAVEWMIDLIDGKKHVTKQDLEDYSRIIDQLTNAYLKRHSPNHQKH